MNFEEKLRSKNHEGLWQEYCGFLDLDLEAFMHIQYRLMEEQIAQWSASPLGRSILKGKTPRTLREFREQLPLTTYGDYAEILLQKKEEMLPDKPILWIETTWEGGKHPVKVAPYTKAMLDTYRTNAMAVFMLSTGDRRGEFNIRPGDHLLYGLAPLPYATGLLPLLLDAEVRLEFLPPVKEAEGMTFGQRNRLGFEMGTKKGIELFFGLSSVAHYIGESFSVSNSGTTTKRNLLAYSPRMVLRYVKAKLRCRRTGAKLKPKDLFRLKGFVCAGVDSRFYKDALEDLWGRRPLEISAGTEPTCIGTENWDKNGLYFFPDACFYEFIPEEEMLKNLENPQHQPKTYLMDEVLEGKNYEIVLTVLKGGAFARYRVGDVYRCLSSGRNPDNVQLPRFAFLDRVPGIIDIAGFTRITEHTIQDVIGLSGLKIHEWIAAKEYTPENRPYLHLYVELTEEAHLSSGVSASILSDHLSIYFKYADSDYQDLKRLLGMDPLKVTILTTGTFGTYRNHTDRPLARMNPDRHDLADFLRHQALVHQDGKGGLNR